MAVGDEADADEVERGEGEDGEDVCIYRAV